MYAQGDGAHVLDGEVGVEVGAEDLAYDGRNGDVESFGFLVDEGAEFGGDADY